MSFSDYLTSGGKVLNESRDYGSYIQKKKAEFGDKFDDSELSKQFIPYYENGKRIEVDVQGEGIVRGRVGVTTGWKPVFLLVPTTRSTGSSTTLSDKDKIIRVVSEAIDPKHAPDGKKRWHRMDNIGKAKYTINFHDGVKTHPDGSKFYDMRIFKNKPDMEAFIQELTKQGYVEAKSPLYEGESTWQGNALPGIRSVREDLGLEPGDTSRDEEIHAMSFKEYLGHYLAWEGIIGYTATIAGIAAVMGNKLRK